MNTGDLFRALPDDLESKYFLLFEAGAQPEEAFLTFKASHEPKLHSLYLHPQLTEFQNYGPWLLEVSSREQLAELIRALPGCVAVLASGHYLQYLAIQLSRGCVIVSPQNTASLVRFYANHVITVLAECADEEWHALLFDGITQWWLPGESDWWKLPLPALKFSRPTAHSTVRLNSSTWQRIADNPEITSVLHEWQQMPTSKVFPPCAQRLMVMKALAKAEGLGLEKPEDRTLYAFCYLNGGKKMLHAEPVCKLLPEVAAGKMKLADVLTKKPVQ